MKKLSEKDDSEIIDDLFSTEIKGNVNAPYRLMRALERCNVLMCKDDIDAFQASVRSLLGDVPIAVREIVDGKSDEYNFEKKTWHYKKWCGHPLGTPENPLTIDGKPALADWSNVSSPLPTIEKYTDYEMLLQIIKAELEKAGGTWRYEKKTHSSPKSSVVSKKTTKIIESKCVELLLELRKQGIKISYDDMIKSQIGRTPSTPVLED